MYSEAENISRKTRIAVIITISFWSCLLAYGLFLPLPDDPSCAIDIGILTLLPLVFMFIEGSILYAILKTRYAQILPVMMFANILSYIVFFMTQLLLGTDFLPVDIASWGIFLAISIPLYLFITVVIETYIVCILSKRAGLKVSKGRIICAVLIANAVTSTFLFLYGCLAKTILTV